MIHKRSLHLSKPHLTLQVQEQPFRSAEIGFVQWEVTFTTTVLTDHYCTYILSNSLKIKNFWKTCTATWHRQNIHSNLAPSFICEQFICKTSIWLDSMQTLRGSFWFPLNTFSAQFNTQCLWCCAFFSSESAAWWGKKKGPHKVCTSWNPIAYDPWWGVSTELLCHSDTKYENSICIS